MIGKYFKGDAWRSKEDIQVVKIDPAYCGHYSRAIKCGVVKKVASLPSCPLLCLHSLPLHKFINP